MRAKMQMANGELLGCDDCGKDIKPGGYAYLKIEDGKVYRIRCHACHQKAIKDGMY